MEPRSLHDSTIWWLESIRCIRTSNGYDSIRARKGERSFAIYAGMRNGAIFATSFDTRTHGIMHAMVVLQAEFKLSQL